MNDSCRATVMVYSCDSYEDVWDPFFKLMSRYWKDCPYPIVLNTESKTLHKKYGSLDISTLSLYKENVPVPYGKRVIDHLNRIKSKYIITLIDDFFIRAEVNTSELEQIMDWMDADNRIASFCLIHHDDPHSCRYSREEQGYKHYSLRPRYTKHNYDMQACVWNREALLKSWRPYESPWQWEGPSNIRSFDDGYLYYDLDDDAPFPIDYIDYKKHEWSGIRKGKWVLETVKKTFDENGIIVDYSKRGIFDPNVDIPPPTHSLGREIAEIRCYGWRRLIPATVFKVKRFIATRVMKIDDYPLNYSPLRDNQYVGRFLPPDTHKNHTRLSGTVCGENHWYTLWRILVCLT